MSSLERKLGSVENLFHVIHDFGGMIDVNIARIEGDVQPHVLQKALLLLQKRYPLLRVRIIDLEDGYYFSSENIQKIPLRVITKTDENQWLEVAESELHQKFSQDFHPLCRIILLKSSLRDGLSEIIATFHHSITDGLSCMNFIDNLLIYYHKIVSQEEIYNPTSLDFPPPIEQKLNRNLVNCSQTEDTKNENSSDSWSPQLIIENEASLNERRTHIINRIINSETLLNLKRQSKTQATTIHGALCAAMLLGTKTISSFEEPVNLSCSSSIDLRKYCQPEIDINNFGCFVSIIENMHILSKNTDFWDLARNCKQKIELTKNQTINNMIDGQRLANFSQLTLEKMLEKNPIGRIQMISVSNRGKINLAKNYGRLKIKEIYFATGQHILGPCLWLGAVTFHEKLCLSFAHVTPLISSQTMNNFADSVVSILEKVANEESLIKENG
ncbi:condensation domain-containing protein [Crocosphaera sp. Alani8]|uniref:condensation domain-containing protein n=1 Tax=Crocosphaera sp. Alani8 TaxID=3038952 RepID=UPI00313D2736